MCKQKSKWFLPTGLTGLQLPSLAPSCWHHSFLAAGPSSPVLPGLGSWAAGGKHGVSCLHLPSYMYTYIYTHAHVCMWSCHSQVLFCSRTAAAVLVALRLFFVVPADGCSLTGGAWAGIFCTWPPPCTAAGVRQCCPKLKNETLVCSKAPPSEAGPSF